MHLSALGFKFRNRGAFVKLPQKIVSIITAKPIKTERLNATRMGVAADGLTEANLYFVPTGQNVDESRHSSQSTAHKIILEKSKNRA